MRTPSPQQQDVIDSVQDLLPQTRGKSLRVIAVAGAGKTSTLVAAVQKMTGSVAFCAYNKKIATEIEQKIREAGVGSNVKAGTFHSFGFKALQFALKVNPKTWLDDKKTLKLAEQLEVPESYFPFVKAAVSLAKQRAIGVLTSFDDWAAWNDLVTHFELDEALTNECDEALSLDERVQQGLRYAQAVLKQSIKTARQFGDFDDMIYLPLALDVRMWQNDWVLVDEAQDTNPARRALARKMLKPSGRLVAVGDPHQAIYGFTGADADSLDLIKRDFGCVDLPLTTTYRCPKQVVALAQTWVRHITAHESAPEGMVQTITDAEFFTYGVEQLTKDDAVLCRNTKPLVALAYSFIRRSIPCHVEGRDIGQGLKALVGKWRTNSLEALLDKLDAYLLKETERLTAKGQEQKVASLTDKVETAQVMIEGVLARNPQATKNDLLAEIDRLFSDTRDGETSPNLTLSTVHKSKGREWNRVYLYGRSSYMPSRFARQEWQLEQEANLCYVAVTRAKQTLIEVEVA